MKMAWSKILEFLALETKRVDMFPRCLGSVFRGDFAMTGHKGIRVDESIILSGVEYRGGVLRAAKHKSASRGNHV